MADSTRLALFACLAKCARPCSVSEVAACCAVDFSVVSRHLAALAQAGLLHAEKRGRGVWYTVRFAKLSTRLRALADAIDQCAPGCCTDAPVTECCAGGCGCGGSQDRVNATADRIQKRFQSEAQGAQPRRSGGTARKQTPVPPRTGPAGASTRRRATTTRRTKGGLADVRR